MGVRLGWVHNSVSFFGIWYMLDNCDNLEVSKISTIIQFCFCFACFLSFLHWIRFLWNMRLRSLKYHYMHTEKECHFSLLKTRLALAFLLEQRVFFLLAKKGFLSHALLICHFSIMEQRMRTVMIYISSPTSENIDAFLSISWTILHYVRTKTILI